MADTFATDTLKTETKCLQCRRLPRIFSYNLVDQRDRLPLDLKWLPVFNWDYGFTVIFFCRNDTC